MNAIRRIGCSFIVAIGMCVFSGSAMAFDLGGMLNKIDNAVKGGSNRDAELKDLQEGPRRRMEESQKSERERASAAQINNSMNILPAGAPKNAEEYCQKITTNPSIIQLSKEMDEFGKASAGITHTYLDNENGDLEKWVTNNFSKLIPIDPMYKNSRGKKEDQLSPQTPGYGAYKGTILTAMSWVNECAVKSYKAKTPFFIVAADLTGGGRGVDDEINKVERALTKGGAEYKVVSVDDNQTSIKEFTKTVSSGRLMNNGYPSPRLATLLAFLFPGVEDIISSTSPDAGASFKLAIKKRKESIAKEASEKDIKLYGGVRAVYNFRKNPAISGAYNSCVVGEKDFQLKLTSDLEAKAKNSNTVAEQGQINAVAKYRRDNINYIAEGMCIYRLSFALMDVQFQNVAGYNSSNLAAVAAKMDIKETADLNSKFTPTALAKIADILKLPADKFIKTKIEDPFNAAYEEAAKRQSLTKAQKEELLKIQNNGFAMLSAVYKGAIQEQIIEPLIQGKIR